MQFPTASEIPLRLDSVEFRSPGQMTPGDRALMAVGEPSLRDLAELKGLGLSQGKWQSWQVVCPALPNHLLLKFTRDNGAGDVSVFTASIPRGKGGRVRVIPLQRRSYSLFSPAPINAMTIAAFNRIQAEEQPGGAPDWLTMGLCYAALVGAQPGTATPQEGTESRKFSVGAGAVVEIRGEGGAVIRFTDAVEIHDPMDWAMAFDGKGRLLKAEHTPAPPMAPRTIAGSTADGPVRVLPQSSADWQGKP
jgi:hypothetical protein